MEVVRTYLEMRAPRAAADDASALPDRIEADVRRVAAPTAEEYRALYREVGEDYHWRDRLAWSDAQLADYLGDPAIELWVLTVAGRRAGDFELRRGDGATEIVYFGLTPPFIGRGLGRFLLARAIDEGWRTPGTTKLWLHTCTLDSPAALPNYLARGFRVVRTERYAVDDLDAAHPPPAP